MEHEGSEPAMPKARRGGKGAAGKRAVTVGSAVVDIIAVVANQDIERLTLQNSAASFLLLEPGRKIEADSISIHTGGGAINTAVALARLGYRTAPLVKIGRDLNAAKVLETFATEDLDDRLVCRSDKFATGVAVMISAHDRDPSIFTYRGANTRLTTANIPRDAFAGADLVYVSGLSNDSADCFPGIIRQAKAAGAFVATNPGIRQLSSRQEAFLGVIGALDLLTLNKVEAAALLPGLVAQGAVGAKAVHPPCPGVPPAIDLPPLLRSGIAGERADVTLPAFMTLLNALGPAFVAVTDGSKGAYVSGHGHLVYCPALPAEVAGTAGAGDAFAATLAAGLSAGAAMADAMVVATINAASVVGFVDTQSGLLKRAEIEARMGEARAALRIQAWR
jgi:ribokinase